MPQVARTLCKTFDFDENDERQRLKFGDVKGCITFACGTDIFCIRAICMHPLEITQVTT